MPKIETLLSLECQLFVQSCEVKHLDDPEEAQQAVADALLDEEMTLEVLA